MRAAKYSLGRRNRFARVKIIDWYNRIYILLVQLFNYIELFIKLLQNAQRFVMGDLAYFLLSSPLPLQSSRILKSKEVTISRKCRFTRSFHKDQVLHFTCVCIRVFTRVRVRVCMRVYNRLSENSSRYIYERSFADSGFSKAICRLQVYRDCANTFRYIPASVPL